jgi:hypothetical protein
MRIVAGLVLVAITAGCASHGSSPVRSSDRPADTPSSYIACRLSGLSVELTAGGIAMTSDFAVIEIRNRRAAACRMSSTLLVTALDGQGQPVNGLSPMRSRSRRRPTVLAPAGIGERAAAAAGETDGIGMLLSGSDPIGYDNGTGCPAGDFVTPRSWRVALGHASLTLPKRTPNAARALTGCRIPGVGGGGAFSVSRQTLNHNLPVQPQPA